MARTSNKREEILQFLTKFVAENGYAPSVREICQAVGLQSTATVHYHLNALRDAGLISMDDMKKRTISLPDSRRADRIPVVGVVTAGLPVLAVENIEGYLPWEGEPGCFALRVRGDSMIGAGILDGDKVVVRPQSTAENGEIVVALLDDSATVKRFKRSDRGVWLMPENPNFQPIDGREAKIIGRVKAVIRNY
jgi:repressor LexA